MPQIDFTSHLQRHVECGPLSVEGSTVSAVVEAACAAFPNLRGYILDDVGRVRKHIMLFVDSEPLRDRTALSDPVKADSTIYVMQALSGG